MAVYIKPGEIIEGKTVDCIARRWDWKGLKKHPITQKRMTLYVTDKNSSASIIKVINIELDEELASKTKHFHRMKDDQLKADALSVYVDKIQRVNHETKEGVSGRHGANRMYFTDHTIAEIKTSLDTYKKLLGYSNNLAIE